MAEFTLPANSKIGIGRDLQGAGRRQEHQDVQGLSLDAGRRQEPVARHLRSRPGHLRADGSRRADQDQERDRQLAHLPPLVPRGRVRLVRDEHRRHQYAGLHQVHRRREGRHQDLPAAAHAGGARPGARPHRALRPARLDRAVAEDRPPSRRRASACSRPRSAPSSTACGSASCASAARPRARPTGGTASAISARPSCCRPIAGSPTAATRRRASGSTSSRIRSGSIAATPS